MDAVSRPVELAAKHIEGKGDRRKNFAFDRGDDDFDIRAIEVGAADIPFPRIISSLYPVHFAVGHVEDNVARRPVWREEDFDLGSVEVGAADFVPFSPIHLVAREVQCEPSRSDYAGEQDFDVGAIEIGAADGIGISLRPVHPALGSVQGDIFRSRCFREQDFGIRAVQIGALDGGCPARPIHSAPCRIEGDVDRILYFREDCNVRAVKVGAQEPAYLHIPLGPVDLAARPV